MGLRLACQASLMNPLCKKGLRGLIVLFLLMAALLFGAAETLHYWQAWLYLAVYVAASIAISLYLIRKDPALLARPMSAVPCRERAGTANRHVAGLGRASLRSQSCRRSTAASAGRIRRSGSCWRVTSWCCLAGTAFTSSSGKTALPRRRSNPLPISGPFRPRRTPGFAISAAPGLLDSLIHHAARPRPRGHGRSDA